MKGFTLIILIAPSLLLAKMNFELWGKDRDLTYPPQKEKKENLQPTGKIAHKIINFYQTFISPANGSRSNFRPTSSKYMELAIKRFGFFQGFIMGCDRLMRENEEKWIYREIVIDNITYKYDPAHFNKSYSWLIKTSAR